MFIEQQKYIEVELYYKNSKSGNSIKVLAPTDISKMKPDEKAKFTKVLLKLRPMSWRTYNDLMRESKTTNPITMAEDTDWSTYRERKLIRLLAEWDAIDKNGNPVQINEETIMSLHPIFAESIINEYDKKVYMDEEEQKN